MGRSASGCGTINRIIVRLTVSLVFQSQMTFSSFATSGFDDGSSLSESSSRFTNEEYDHLPQHRIRSSKRSIDYGNHPWQEYQDRGGRRENRNKSGRASIPVYPVSEKADRNFDRHLSLHDGIIQETLLVSGIEMISTISGAVKTPPTEIPLEQELSENNNTDSEHIPKPESMRIRAALLSQISTGSAYLSLSKKEQILTSIIQPALQSFSQALAIIPVQDKLIIDRDQLYDSISCGPGVDSGLPSVVVPTDHLEDGVDDTDLMIYLSVGFHGTLLNDLEVAFHDDNINVRRNMNVVNGTDNGWEGGAEPSSAPGMEIRVPSCSGSYLASSTFCSTDQYDRPIAGMLHLCIGEDFFEEQNLMRNQVMIMHELGHILGFNSLSLAHFRDKLTGEPLTKRDESNGDVKDVEVECTGVADRRGNATIPLPSSNILQFRNIRGGQRVAQVVTPNVRQVARNHFGCQRLEGAELETFWRPLPDDQTPSTLADRCISDHWERRLFKADIMNPIVDSVKSIRNISPLTLAYFMDSGWYDVNIDRAAEPDVWGRGAGCEFMEEQCILNGQVNEKNSQFFCNSESQNGCTDDMMGKGTCLIVSYDHDIATEFQYLMESNLGGHDVDLDFCPSFVGKELGLCAMDDAKSTRLEETGESSRCLSGVRGKDKNAALCVPVACAIEQKTLHVRVDEIWKQCEYEGQVIQSWFDDGDYVICPDPVRTCPSFFCPRDCLFDGFTGVCDDELQQCICPFRDFSPGGVCNETSDLSFVLDMAYGPLYVTDSSGLISDQKDIFDRTARMFFQMSPGEVLGFIASSLIAVGVCFIIGTHFVRCIRQPGCRMPKLWDNEWRLDAARGLSFGMEEGERQNKDKMVASVLHNMRVESNAPCPVEDPNDTATSPHERIFYRSELPPLPGVGRIISVVGSTYVNDSLVPNDIDETMTLDGTADDSRTSGVNDLNSGRGVAPDIPRTQYPSNQLRSRSRLHLG